MIVILMFLIIFVAVIWMFFARIHKQYSNIKKIMPADTKNITRIVPMGGFKEYFGNDKNHRINYLVSNENKEISFPESNLPNRIFYLTGISFNPNIDQRIKQKSNAGSALAGYAVAGGVGAVIGASKKHKATIKNEEHQTIGMIRLYSPSDKHIYSFQVQMDSNKYRELSALYLLGPDEISQIMPTMK